MRVRILGAGIVGLACADELLHRGHHVTVVDPTPARGASYAAAGMLSPASELWHGEEEVFRLGSSSLALWPGFADRLGVSLSAPGTLLVGLDAGDLQRVDRQLELLAAAGVRALALTRREVLAREPRLGRVSGGAFMPDELSVDPREVTAALLRRVPVAPAAHGPADVTVLATGASLPEPFAHLVHPVRGEIVRVRTADPVAGTVRAWVHDQPVYVVPRRMVDGLAEVVVGATSEEVDRAAEPTVEGVHRLLDTARRVVPGLDRATFVEAVARDRPATRDHQPLVGPSGVDGVVLAAGTYRNGVLLAPLVARLLADHLETGAVEPATDPRRFTLERSPS